MKHLPYTSELPSEFAGGGHRSVYSTFDDGPNSFFTPQIIRCAGATSGSSEVPRHRSLRRRPAGTRPAFMNTLNG
ncbi:hypothetical protein IHQ72_34390 [Mesorhizobium onobrychidis]|uniref:Uncharacterized protein n=1 Tax=Mesorhizobium onobrychidis TaxID=2775404 RepID=A0ABY5QW82_9HYPH|nr:hypothetical protein IHQ72_34390 [Mesorhizobium onobrychidis]